MSALRACTFSSAVNIFFDSVSNSARRLSILMRVVIDACLQDQYGVPTPCEFLKLSSENLRLTAFIAGDNFDRRLQLDVDNEVGNVMRGRRERAPSSGCRLPVGRGDAVWREDSTSSFAMHTAFRRFSVVKRGPMSGL